ncbi:hypothetical protein MAPG_11891, partial [Magnaporthiopsis poae ATCC 64411]
ELDRWEATGAIEVRRAYSRRSEASDGCRHVQDRMLSDRERLLKLWQDGAKVFVCGSRAVEKSVMDAMVRIKVDKDRELGRDTTDEHAKGYLDGLRNARYATDVFD